MQTAAEQLLEKLTEAYARRDLLNIDKKNAVPADVQKGTRRPSFMDIFK